MRVLIVKTSSLSSIVQALPALDYLHQVSPGIEVDWVAEEQYCEILEGHPLIGQLHRLRSSDWRRHPLARRTLREIMALRNALQERRYDRIFDIEGYLKSGIISWMTGSSERFGFTSDSIQDRVNALFTTRQVPLRRQDLHFSDQCLRQVSLPFAKDYRLMELTAQIPCSPEDELTAATLLATLGDGLVFLFHCGSRYRTRQWSDGRWGELGRAVLTRYPDAAILLTWGDATERDQVIRLSAIIGNGARVIDRYPLKGLAALLRKVDLVVGGDVGPLQIAAAVGTPTVSIYRSSDPRRSGPRGAHHAIIQAPVDCSGCFRTTCDRDRECSEKITAEMVMKSIEAVLGKESMK